MMMKTRVMHIGIIIACLFSFFLVYAYAEPNTYTIPALNLNISIPDEYDVFTLDMPSDDPLFSSYGMTKADVDARFSADSIYFNAVSTVRNEEIVVTMTDSPLMTLNGLGDTTLLVLASALMDEYANYGITVTDYDIYHHAQLTFIRICFHDAEESVYGLQFYTVSNSQAMNFTLRSYEGSITNSQKDAMCAIIDSIHLNYNVEIGTKAETNPAFLYTDNDTGITFTVPEGWNKIALTEQRNYVDAKFESTSDPGLVILYGSIDFWSEMPANERREYSRSVFSSEYFTKQDIAGMFDTSQCFVNDVIYGGVHYFKINTTEVENVMGLNVSVPMTQLFRAENGWGYIFQFGGDEDSQYYSEFVSLVESADYSGAKKNEYMASVTVFVVAFATIVAVSAFITMKRRKQNKSVLEASTTCDRIEQHIVAQERCCFCHVCGARQPAGSAFCYKCGAKL